MNDQYQLFSVEARAVISMDRQKPAKREFKISTPAELAGVIANAIAEGRHKIHWQTVCCSCREWVDGIFHVDPQDRLRRYCRKCAAKFGVEGAAEKKAVEDSSSLIATMNLPLPPGVSRVEDIGLPEQL